MLTRLLPRHTTPTDAPYDTLGARFCLSGRLAQRPRFHHASGEVVLGTHEQAGRV